MKQLIKDSSTDHSIELCEMFAILGADDLSICNKIFVMLIYI